MTTKWISVYVVPNNGSEKATPLVTSRTRFDDGPISTAFTIRAGLLTVNVVFS